MTNLTNSETITLVQMENKDPGAININIPKKAGENYNVNNPARLSQTLNSPCGFLYLFESPFSKDSEVLHVRLWDLLGYRGFL